MKNIDSSKHVRGESLYLDDIPLREGTLFGAVFASPIASGLIRKCDVSAALSCPGVHSVVVAADIPGVNQIGSILPDEPLLAEKTVHYIGQPIALVLAESEDEARAARSKIHLEYLKRPVLTDARAAAYEGQLLHPPRTFRLGNPDKAWNRCDHIFEGTTETGGQEHLYIETQGAYVYPLESGGYRIHSSTQGPTAVQRTVAAVLDLPMHALEVDVVRLGGGFGGKEDQATPWAVLAALGSKTSGRPVKLVLHRLDDMAMTGKRHPYSSSYRIGLDEDLRITAYEVDFYQNSGAAADLSPAILERTLFHHTNTYFIPNCRATAYPCRTNLPPNTAFRGFGGPQAMFVIEAAIAHAAESLGVTAEKIQKKNLLDNGDSFPYGQKVKRCQAQECWQELEQRFRINHLREQVEAFNVEHELEKKGLAIMPICFGISFTATFLNQASALVHIYADGSVRVSTAAVEMGQGVNTKMAQVAASTLGINPDRVHIDSTNTARVANTSPSAASASADLNGKALEMACVHLKQRLTNFATSQLAVKHPKKVTLRNEWIWIEEQQTDLGWEDLVQKAYFERISLSEQMHYATPGVSFNKTKEKGSPFAYHVYGAAAVVARLDCLRGTYIIESVDLVHDVGKSMNPTIDLGQIEGALVQGIGWMTMEELIYDDSGQLRSNALSTYKVPDIYAAPERVAVHFHESEGAALAIQKSKAVGEPPLMYGIGAFFAIRNAILAFRPGPVPFDAPLTPEKVLLALYPDNAPLFATKESSASATH